MFSQLKIVIAGGSGFIGGAMAGRWSAQNEVVILARGGAAVNNSYASTNRIAGVQYLHWDGRTAGEWTAALEGCDMLINLSGRSVNCHYNAANKAEIFTSRLDSTRALGAAIQQCSRPPKLWINGASATIYPHAADAPRDESFTAFADDFSVQVCKAWEAAFNGIPLPQTRKALLRMAIVLGEGGVMTPYRRLAKLGLGGRQGSGRQMFSWIHITDLCRIVEWLWERPAADGVFNASAPTPVTNADFMASLRKRMHVPIGLPAPEWTLKIGAAIIGTEPELLLKSRWVIPGRLLNEGFSFQYPDIEAAMAHL